MGAWFADFLKKNGYKVIIQDKNTTAAKSLAKKNGYRFVRSQNQAVSLGQLIILTTPTRVTLALLQRTSRALNREKLLVEISSIKEPVRRTIQRLVGLRIAVLSIHPMFGPGSQTLAGKAMFITSAPPSNEMAEALLSLFRRKGVLLFRIDSERHDQLIALILALPHFVNNIFANTLKTFGENPNRLREMAGTTFRLQLLTAEAISQEDAENELSMLMDTKETLKVLKRFLRQCITAAKAVEKGQRKRLRRILVNGRRYGQKDRMFATAYERFSAAVEASSLV
jgi:chorismate mutase/prephenate dehydrogenase